MKKPKSNSGKPAIDLIEEAVHSLRRAPAPAWLYYYTGSIPFVLGLLYFWTDMSANAFAARHCALSALEMTLLFTWMKFWQSRFASDLRRQFSAQGEEKWTGKTFKNVWLNQALIQPSKLFILPLAALITIPFGWTIAFYDNATVLDEGMELRPLLQRAARQARIWPGQNHKLVIFILVAALGLWLNFAIAMLSAPFLLKMLLGIETAFTRGGVGSILNTTFFAATFAVTYLALDPLIKTIYTLRTFYGEARMDGADLAAELNLLKKNGVIIPLLAMFCLLGVNSESHAVTKAPNITSESVAGNTVAPEKLDEALKQTLAKDKYAWRLPREKIAESEESKGWLATFIASVADTLGRWARGVRDGLRDFFEWIEKLFKTKETESGGKKNETKTDWMGLLRVFAYVLLFLAAAALVLLIWRVYKQGLGRKKAVMAEVIAPLPNLEDETISASQLPEDGWLKLAREMMEKGDFRLALRALYLSSLAHLAEREVVRLAQFKSNHDYEVEVALRGRAQTGLSAIFSENVLAFNQVWYGFYEVTPEAVQHFQGNVERIRAC